MIVRRNQLARFVLPTHFSLLGEAVMLAFTAAPVIGLMGLLAYLLREPLLFPSLGATVYLFFSTPLAPAASPRHALIGHGVGIISRWPSSSNWECRMSSTAG